jgi:transposase
MPRLNEDQQNNAIGRLQAGETQTHVYRVLNVSQSNISRLWDRYQQQGSTHDRPRSGPPRVTTPAQNRHIRLRHLLQQQFLDSVEFHTRQSVTAYMKPE